MTFTGGFIQPQVSLQSLYMLMKLTTQGVGHGFPNGSGICAAPAYLGDTDHLLHS